MKFTVFEHKKFLRVIKGEIDVMIKPIKFKYAEVKEIPVKENPYAEKIYYGKRQLFDGRVTEIFSNKFPVNLFGKHFLNEKMFLKEPYYLHDGKIIYIWGNNFPAPEGAKYIPQQGMRDSRCRFYIIFNTCKLIRLSELTNEDAKRAGFESLEDYFSIWNKKYNKSFYFSKDADPYLLVFNFSLNAKEVIR